MTIEDKVPSWHEKELELFCRAENIETPHVYECEYSNKLRYRCLDCGCPQYILNIEAIETMKELKERYKIRDESNN